MDRKEKSASVIVYYREFAPIVEAFEALGYQVHHFTKYPSVEEIAAITDAVLYLVCMYDEIKKPLRALRIKKLLNDRGAPVIAWNRDGPTNKGEKAWRMWLLQHLEFFDVYASHTLQQAEAFCERCLYLPNAAWTKYYNLGQRTLDDLRNPTNYRYDVSFHGRIDAEKYPEMRDREVFFKALAERLDALGLTYCFTGQKLDFSQQRELIQTTRININQHAGCDSCQHGKAALPERSWGLPERCYGVPACGGFLLSDHREHGKDDFPGEGEWQSFEGLDDCMEKIQYWLANFDELRNIADAQHARVMACHTYELRAQALLDAALEWAGSREQGRG